MLPVSIVEMPSIVKLVDMLALVPAAAVPVTPGARSASAVKLRFESGRFWTDSVGMVSDRSPLAAWMTGASALTSTVSAAPPTSSVRVPTVTRDPALTGTPVRLSVLNEGIVTSIV